MNATLRITMLIAVVLYFIGIITLLRRKMLSLRYSLLWLFAGILMLLTVLFPAVPEAVFHALGIVELTNGLFALVLFFMLLIMVSFTVIVSGLNERIRQLCVQCAMYEKRIRELERQIPDARCGQPEDGDRARTEEKRIFN